jgi:hypothetical protein
MRRHEFLPSVPKALNENYILFKSTIFGLCQDQKLMQYPQLRIVDPVEGKEL